MGFVDDLVKYKTQFLRVKQNGELSEHTIRHYKTGFRYFFEYLAVANKKKRGKLSAEDVDENFIYDFLEWLERGNQNIKQSTKKAYLIRVGGFLRYISKKSNGQYNFRDSLEDVKIKVPKMERNYLSQEEQKRLYDYFSYLEACTDPRDAQKVLIAKLLFFTGIRAIELRQLRCEHFVFDDGVYEFVVTGKGNKQRRLYIAASLIQNEILVLSGNNKNLICATRSGKAMVHSHLWKYTRRIFEEAGIDETGVHIFRHTFARVLVDKGVNLITIKELLGHGDIKTTQIYAKSNEAAKKSALISVF